MYMNKKNDWLSKLGYGIDVIIIGVFIFIGSILYKNADVWEIVYVWMWIVMIISITAGVICMVFGIRQIEEVSTILKLEYFSRLIYTDHDLYEKEDDIVGEFHDMVGIKGYMKVKDSFKKMMEKYVESIIYEWDGSGKTNIDFIDRFFRFMISVTIEKDYIDIFRNFFDTFQDEFKQFLKQRNIEDIDGVVKYIKNMKDIHYSEGNKGNGYITWFIYYFVRILMESLNQFDIEILHKICKNPETHYKNKYENDYVDSKIRKILNWDEWMRIIFIKNNDNENSIDPYINSLMSKIELIEILVN